MSLWAATLAKSLGSFSFYKEEREKKKEQQKQNREKRGERVGEGSEGELSIKEELH